MISKRVSTISGIQYTADKKEYVNIGTQTTYYNEYGDIIRSDDSTGNVIDVEYKYDNGKMVWKKVTSMSMNLIVSKGKIFFNSDGIVIRKIIISYTNNKITKVDDIFYSEAKSNHELFHVIRDLTTKERFTITALEPDKDHVIKFKDKNGKFTRAELYDIHHGRLIKLEDYPGDNMDCYGYYEDTRKVEASMNMSIITNQIRSSEYNYYDKDGNIVKSEKYDFTKNEKTVDVMTYDNGRVVKVETTVYPATGENMDDVIDTKTTITSYNDRGDMICVENDELRIEYEYTHA